MPKMRQAHRLISSKRHEESDRFCKDAMNHYLYKRERSRVHII
ncbi:hypothetical protein [Leptolyngbya sp. FACHB-671]|nr:hypothetical protein [Leptolyngbya sp. FACHB-671]